MQVRKTAEFCGFQGLSGISWDGIGGGDGGIRTLDTRSRYGSLAGNWFQPLTHVSATQCRLRAAAYNHHAAERQGGSPNFFDLRISALAGLIR